ncbi:U4/U6 small nuclear ribonucleoprotein PRP4-like protein [Aristolochia californica]|uniref:U4/U6 small nuclear ribonucleoprotein PRP4-like protein n=1 Tax=Aristolochia californica TaxID=171875 RepID=UPI0035D6DFB9
MEEEKQIAVSHTEPSETTPMDSTPVPVTIPPIPPTPVVPIQPPPTIIRPLVPPVPPPVIPPIAPVNPISARPLAPLPIRAPHIRPPVLVSQNGDSKLESGSDREGSAGPASTAEYEISEESKLVRERQEKAMQELLLKRRAYALAVPTNDAAVRARLRRLGEPMTLFGEREMERRDRLRSIMVKLDAEGQLDKLLKAHEEDEAAAGPTGEDEEEGPQYPFYTEGSKSLLEARISIANFSIARAASRLERARRRRDDPDEDFDAEMDLVIKQVGSFVLDCSEIGDDRPVSGCSFSNDGTLLATSAWSGAIKLWSMPKVAKFGTLKGHTERATDVVFSPVNNQLASASADRTAKLWNTDGTLLKSFEGHLDRLARVGFHPSGRYLGTTSFDKTWRLWDVESGEELLLQEGHSRSVYGISFHQDGSLVASCGLDALARVWDLRTGRSILALEGHVKPVLGLSFSPNGYHLATGSEDNTCRIWDLRKKKSLYIIPAHSHLISQVKYEQQEGYFLATASYDMTAKIWSARDFKPVKVLAGHEAKVTSLDIAGDGQSIATVAHDRTIKLWSGSDSNNGQGRMDVD